MTTTIRMIAFDVDGTLIHNEQDKTIWQLLNRRFHGDDELNRQRFAAFRNGELTYDEWVALDIIDWKSRGARRPQLEQVIRENLSVVPHAQNTVSTLKKRGYTVIVISGTLSLTFELLLSDFEFDRVYSNRIWFDDDGRIDGWQATPFDVEGKAEALEQSARDFGFEPAQCAFVGDSWNDLPVFASAGFSVAFRPKSKEVRDAVDVVVDAESMREVLDLFPGVA